jgi:hypothetical protein
MRGDHHREGELIGPCLGLAKLLAQALKISMLPPELPE